MFFNKTSNRETTLSNNVKKKNLLRKFEPYKVGNHDQLTGYFRGTAHVFFCNLRVQSRYTHFVPMVLHIMSKNDSRVFLRKSKKEPKTCLSKCYKRQKKNSFRLIMGKYDLSNLKDLYLCA